MQGSLQAIMRLTIVLGASVGGPGPLSAPLWVVLGRSQGLCGRCWAVWGPLLVVLGRLGSALGCYVGDLGPLLGPMLAVLGEKWLKPKRGRDLASGSGPRSGPNPSGKAVLGRGPKTRGSGARAPLLIFFCRYILAETCRLQRQS